jgi:transcriptional regulator with XRE-family HTH domain
MAASRLELVRLRRDLGLSQEALAKQLGVHVKSVRRWEHGETAPTLAIRPHLARMLTISVPRLMEILGSPSEQPTCSFSGEIGSALEHLEQQWHLLVRADNLFGPRHALAGVNSQLAIIERLLELVRGQDRRNVLRLASTYAESASWLHEGVGDLPRAQQWVRTGVSWAREAGYDEMVVWACYRESQLATDAGEAQRALSLAKAARRHEERLPRPTRAALCVQEASGHAMVADEPEAQYLFDQAHDLAASDTTGEARAGHGSFSTHEYIEMQRASCWLVLGDARRAVATYERSLPGLPPVYRRDRGVALSYLAQAHVAAGELEQAAVSARAALALARPAGLGRVMQGVEQVGASLLGQRDVPEISLFLEELTEPVGA